MKRSYTSAVVLAVIGLILWVIAQVKDGQRRPEVLTWSGVAGPAGPARITEVSPVLPATAADQAVGELAIFRAVTTPPMKAGHEENGSIASEPTVDYRALLEEVRIASPENRRVLARQLQTLDDSAHNDTLLDLLILFADDVPTCVEIRDALSRTATAEDVEALVQRIPAEPDVSPIRIALLETLALVRGPENIPILEMISEYSKDAAIARAAAGALARIGTPEATASLVDVIKRSQIRGLDNPTAQALMTVDAKDSVDMLQEEFLGTANPVVRYATAFALAARSNQPDGVHEVAPSQP